MQMSNDLRLIDQLCDEFEKAWRAGTAPRIDSHLAEAPESQRPRLFRELLILDLEYRQDLGETPSEQDYLERFAEFAPMVELVFGGDSSTPKQHKSTERGLDTDGDAVAAEQVTSIPGYELMDVLGRGAMGIVYRARQLELDRLVAVKMMLAGRYANEKELSRFRQEAEAVAKLQHPNIVQVFDVGKHQEYPFLTLEFVEGGTLKDRIAGEPQSPRDAAEMCDSIARATHVAHSQGIIHRDLKPGNILLTKEGTPKIADFGLAKRVEGAPDHTRTGELIGTPSYMSPEQASWKNEQIGPTTDVYSLGAILYTMLTGRPPFLSETVWDTVTQVISDDPVPPTRLQPRLPRDLETICLKCLSKEPRHRYQSAEALADDLTRWRSGEPIHARASGRLERTLKWSRRHPARAALMAFSACSLALVIALISVHNYRLQLAIDAKDTAQKDTQREHQTALANAQVAEDNHLLARQAVYDCFVVSTTDPALQNPGMQPVREVLLKSALQYYRGFAEQRGDDPQLQRELAENQRMIGEIEALIGTQEAAVAAFSEAAQLWEAVIAREPDQPEWKFQRGRSLVSAGNASQALGQTSETLRWYGLAIENYSELAELEPEDLRYLAASATSSAALAEALRKQGETQAALAQFEQARDVSQRIAEMSPKNYGHRRDLGVYHSHIGLIWFDLNEPDKALESFESARDTLTALSQDRGGTNLDTERELAASHGMIATLHDRLNRLDLAAAAYEDQRKITERLVAENPRVLQYRHDLAVLNSNLSNVFQKQDKLEEATLAVDRAIEMHRQLSESLPNVLSFRVQLAKSYRVLSGLQRARNQLDAAQQAARESIAIQQALADAHLDVPAYKEELAYAYEQLAGVTSSEDQETKTASLQTAVELLTALAADYADVPRFRTEAKRLAEKLNGLSGTAGSSD